MKKKTLVILSLLAVLGLSVAGFYADNRITKVDDSDYVSDYASDSKSNDPQIIESPLAGKKIIYDGDSICFGSINGGGYAKIIADKVNGTYENHAEGGATLVASSDDVHSIVENLKNLPKDGDLYCFEGGLNDVWKNMPLGTYNMLDFTGKVDETTICGALETIFRYALNNFVGKPVCFVIPHKVNNISYIDYKNFHDCAVAICNKYSIPYYDAFNERGLNGWNEVQKENFFKWDEKYQQYDGIHPNEEGYKKYYVPQLIALFEKIMPVE